MFNTCSTNGITSLLSNDPASTEIYTLSLHDALPISMGQTMDDVGSDGAGREMGRKSKGADWTTWKSSDRKSTRLNSSHANISYAVFCLKKKKNNSVLSGTSLSQSVRLAQTPHIVKVV